MTLTMPNRTPHLEQEEDHHSARTTSVLPRPVASQTPAPAATASTRGDFEQRLLQLIDAQMSQLTSAHALDEWHLDYLDPRITAEVQAEHRRIDAETTSRRAALTARQRTLQARLTELDGQQDLASADVADAQAELDRRVRDTAPLLGIEVPGGSAATAAAVLSVLSGESPQVVVRERGGLSESELVAALATHEHLLQQRTRLVDAQHRAVDRARDARLAAEARYRNSGLAPGSEQVGAAGLGTAAPDDPTAPPAIALPTSPGDEGLSPKAAA